MASENDNALRVNHERMRKNQVIINKVCEIYVAVCGMIAAADLVLTYMSGGLIGLVHTAFALAVLVFGYLGCYCHNNTFAICAAVTSLAALLIMRNVVYALMLAMSVTLFLFTIRANTVYEELSHEPGFPQFDELFEEQKRRSAEADRSRSAVWETQKRAASLHMNDHGEMPVIAVNTDEKMENRAHRDNSGYMDMI